MTGKWADLATSIPSDQLSIPRIVHEWQGTMKRTGSVLPLGLLESNIHSYSPLPLEPPQPLSAPRSKLEGGGREPDWVFPSPPGVRFLCTVEAGGGQDGSLSWKLGDWGCHPLLCQIARKELELGRHLFKHPRSLRSKSCIFILHQKQCFATQTPLLWM